MFQKMLQGGGGGGSSEKMYFVSLLNSINSNITYTVTKREGLYMAVVSSNDFTSPTSTGKTVAQYEENITVLGGARKLCVYVFDCVRGDTITINKGTQVTVSALFYLSPNITVKDNEIVTSYQTSDDSGATLTYNSTSDCILVSLTNSGSKSITPINDVYDYGGTNWIYYAYGEKGKTYTLNSGSSGVFGINWEIAIPFDYT